MVWRFPFGATVLAVSLTACGVLPGNAPEPTAVPTTIPTPAASATRPAAPATATPAPKPTNTPEAKASDTVWVGNTDGEGVYLRETPAMADRIRAYPDGTPLTIVGDDVEGEGQSWRRVRTPDGLEGYVPSIYTLDAPP